jgi:hypothetical protein
MNYEDRESDFSELDANLSELLRTTGVYSLNDYDARFRDLVKTINVRLGHNFSNLPKLEKQKFVLNLVNTWICTFPNEPETRGEHGFREIFGVNGDHIEANAIACMRNLSVLKDQEVYRSMVEFSENPMLERWSYMEFQIRYVGGLAVYAGCPERMKRFIEGGGYEMCFNGDDINWLIKCADNAVVIESFITNIYGMLPS